MWIILFSFNQNKTHFWGKNGLFLCSFGNFFFVAIERQKELLSFYENENIVHNMVSECTWMYMSCMVVVFTGLYRIQPKFSQEVKVLWEGESIIVVVE
jgi:hypothetical protein